MKENVATNNAGHGFFGKRYLPPLLLRLCTVIAIQTSVENHLILLFYCHSQ